MNSIQLMGNLTKDAEQGRTSSGSTYARFSIAVQRPFSKDKTDFFDCTAWDKLAENVVIPYAKKGRKVAITGYITFSQGDNGQKYVNVNVNTFEFGDKAERKETEQKDREKDRDIDKLQVVDDSDDIPF